MKKTIYILLLAIVQLAVTTSCSNDDERYIYVKPADVNRNVLIEDFTGQRCLNCPNASAQIDSLIAQYGHDAIIAVSIHSGPLGFKGSAKLTGLATSLGDTYYNHWNCDHQPIGLVNRVGGLQDYPAWPALVRQALSLKSTIEMEATVSYNDTTHEASIKVNMLGTNGTTRGKLQLWVIEDSITAMQVMPDGKAKPDYVHKHVLRAAVNGDWGQDVTIDEGVESTATAHYTVDKAWDPKHLWIVAFVYNNDGVVQVIKSHF